MEPLKVGLMGLGRGGQQLAEALLASSWCRLIAVASSQPSRTEAFRAKHPGIAAYNDFRSLIVENPLDALFVAVPPFLRPKYLALAAERGLPVWMLPPAARRFDEAAELAARFERAGVPLVVSRCWGIEPGLHAGALGLDQFGRFFFARGQVMTCWQQDLDWRGDSVRAGGGVLLDRAYTLIDTAIGAMGLPTTVYTAAAGVSRPGGRFAYDTEDTAAVTCRFAGGGIAVFAACWTAGPDQWQLDLHGAGGTIGIDTARVRLLDRAGGEMAPEQSRPAHLMLPQIEEFLSALPGTRANLRATLRQHLPTMAVIHAAYLSARTGQPESPRAIFEMHDVKETLPVGA